MGDSNVEGGEADIHNEGLNLRTMLEGSNEAIGDDANNIDPVWGEEFDAVTGEEEGRHPQISGAPEGWVPPGPPKAWKGYKPKIELGAPAFADVDNPGSWNLFSFDAKYGTEKGNSKEKGKRKYLGHFTPALAKVVPPDETGNREVQGWKFHYNGWKPDEFDHQTLCKRQCECNESQARKPPWLIECKCAEKAQFFFYQLLIPFCDPELNGIEDDCRMPYFSRMANYTIIYAATSGAWIGMGHAW